MMDIIKTVDSDTFTGNPEKQDAGANKIKKLGEVFEKAGTYLDEYIFSFEKNDDDAKQVAKNIASEFYQYGLSLQHKERNADSVSEDNRKILSPEDKDQLDEWFLGTDAYKKRIARLGENPTEEKKEEMRKHLLQVYFKALVREGYKEEGENPWEIKTGPTQRLQDTAREQITRVVETPEREMVSAIFRRGLEKLVTEMKTIDWRKAVNNFFEKIGFSPPLEQRKLFDVLKIPKLKSELEEVRKTKDTVKISAKELEIAKTIQEAVSSFPYQKMANNPSEMIETQFINCVGSALLGGGLLDAVGIKYLVADLPEHSATVLITSDGKVYWQDFTPPFKPLGEGNSNYKEITVYMSEGEIDFSERNNLSDSEIATRFKDSYIGDDGDDQLKVNLSNPEIGLQAQILNNAGNDLRKLGKNEEAVESCKQAISINPKDPYPYIGLGNALSGLGRNKEAVEAYRQAISINPKDPYPYNGLANALRDLGRNEEAIKTYKKFLSLWKGDIYWIDRAEKRIKELELKEKSKK
ncbi:MAG TPA: tetratricopeptide repeat protein [Candidatus Kaiserbacteria bacterium]|nr:tetratricopeptide repeat protein [Candidatus Kaiserbacteria bacterium]